MTYYEILEVSESASLEVITMAYRTLALKYHPDRYKGDPEFAKTHWKRINAAYLVLSVPDERRQYDEFLRLKRSPGQDVQSETPKEPEAIQKKRKNKKKEKTPPTFKRSAVTVGILLPLALLLDVLGYVLAYIGGIFPLDYALFCGFLDFVLLTFLNMLFPLLIGSIKKNCSLKFVETMPWISSLIIMFLVNALSDPTSGVAVGQVVIYAIISKHILIQMHQKIQQRKHRVIASCAALLVLLFTLTCGLLGYVSIQNNATIITGTPKDTTVYYIGDVYLETEKTSDYYVDINGHTKRINYSAYYMDKNGNLIKINE